MSSAKYTPGPWQAEPMTGRGAWIKGKNGNWSALSCGDTDLEAEANARLIAAAPHLLEVLKMIMEEKAPRYHDCTNDGLPKCAWCFAEEAIANAEAGE